MSQPKTQTLQQSTNPTSANDAIEMLASNIEKAARALAPSDPFTQDDIKQEMYVAILESGNGHERAYYFKRAVGAAKDFLRKLRGSRRNLGEIPTGDLEMLDKIVEEQSERGFQRNSYEVNWQAIDDRLDAEERAKK